LAPVTGRGKKQNRGTPSREHAPTVAPAHAAFIRRRLLAWWLPRKRNLPWRTSSDPYEVLVAEILLQQTHFGKVLPSYNALMRLAPSPRELATVDQSELEAIVRPLGLVGRAKILKRLGAALAERYGGKVPRTEEDLLSLPGVGEYAARAVRCFAYGYSEPLVDRLTARWYGRMFGLAPAARPGRSKQLWNLVREIQPRHPKDFHLAVIDFTSLVCKPMRPDCQLCPLVSLCEYGSQKMKIGDMP
jgi:A/G-specific adenine glycosylase